MIEIKGFGRPDTHEAVSETIREHLAAGVKHVWIAHTFETITVYQQSAPPDLVTEEDHLTAEPELPGFRCQVKQLFRGKRKNG